jgi:hypothetical protein
MTSMDNEPVRQTPLADGLFSTRGRGREEAEEENKNAAGKDLP